MSSINTTRMRMKKSVLSIMLVAFMIVCMLPMRIHTAEASEMSSTSLTVSPNVAEAYPGDSIVFTFSIGPVNDLAGLHIQYAIPEGLTYIGFTQIIPNSALGMGGQVDHNVNRKDIAVTSPDSAYSSSNETSLFSITCTVDDDAVGNSLALTVSDPGTGDYCFDSNWNDIMLSVNCRSVTIAAAPIAPTGVSLDKHEINVDDHTSDQTLTATISPYGADGHLVWSTNNGSVATVTNNNDNTATVTINGVGMANISVTIQGTDYSDVCTVNVSEYICNHENKIVTPEKAASCTEDGNKKYYYCPDCQKYLKADGVTVTTQTEETISAPGHDYAVNIVQIANNEQLGIRVKKCSRCDDVIEEELYLAENTSPNKLPDGTDISSADTSQLSATRNVELDGEDKEVTILLQDPLGMFAEWNIKMTITGVTNDLAENYDGNISEERAYLVRIQLKSDGDDSIVTGSFPKMVRFLFEIPDDPNNPDDDWYEGGIQVHEIKQGEDKEYVEGIEYQVYDADGNYIKVVEKDYAPQDGETVRKFVTIWTDRSGDFALSAGPRTPITITAESAEKAYDGSALTQNAYKTEGLAKGDEVASITINGSQTVVGTSDNVPSAAKIVNAKGENVTASYDITYVNGTLTVTKASAPALTESQKPAPVTDLKENGKDQILVIDPKTLPDGYYVEYSTDGGKTWKTVPTGKDSGEYVIRTQYKAKDDNHTDFFGEDLKVLIAGVYSPAEATAEWTKGSGIASVFHFKKAFNDETCFANFTGVFVDGKETQKDKDYKATKGSTIITFAPEFLETLSTGEHTIKITFKDGESSAVLKVLEAVTTPAVNPSMDSTPTTGDSSMLTLWAAMLLLSMAGATAMIEWKRRTSVGSR